MADMALIGGIISLILFALLVIGIWNIVISLTDIVRQLKILNETNKNGKPNQMDNKLITE